MTPGRAEAGRSICKEDYMGGECGGEKIRGTAGERVVQTRLSQDGQDTTTGNIEQAMVPNKESDGGDKAESGQQAEGNVGAKSDELTIAGRAVGQMSLRDDRRLGELLTMQEEAEKTIEENDREIERIRERLRLPFKMKTRDKQKCHAEIAERKWKVDMAREQWTNCKAEIGAELRRLKAEAEVELKVHEREVAGRSRQIEACKEFSREIQEIQRSGGYQD